MKSKPALLLAFLLTLIIFFNLEFIKNINKPERETAFVLRTIDGDTLELKDGRIIRLLNINTPEKNEEGYELAKNFLKKFENTTVEIEEMGPDKYGRVLARIYSGEYLNLRVVKEGLAKKFLVEDKELEDFSQAEKNAIENEKGIWKKSDYYDCINSEINANKEEVSLQNSCKNINFKDFVITDESRKKYKFKDVEFTRVLFYTKEGIDDKDKIFWNLKQNVWNDDRDTLYLFDKEGNIIHYNVYGY